LLLQQEDHNLECFSTAVLVTIMIGFALTFSSISSVNAQSSSYQSNYSSIPQIETQQGSMTSHSAADMNNLGLQMLKSGKYQQASNYFKSALNIDPNNYTILNNEGLALSLMGNDAEAILYYDKSLQENPDDVFALTNKADSLFIMGNYHGALTYYNKTLALNPNDKHSIDGKDSTLRALNLKK
jgi:tetratricopeptide (TPR) repeat protein